MSESVHLVRRLVEGMWKKRSLAYISPGIDPEKLFGSAFETNFQLSDEKIELIGYENEEESDKIGIKSVNKQVKYSIEDYHALGNPNLNELLDTLQILQITFKKEIPGDSGDYVDGYLDDWKYWMNTGITVNVAPQTAKTWSEYENFSNNGKDEFLNFFKLLTLDSSNSKMVFFKEWFTFNDNRELQYNETDILKRLFGLLQIEDLIEIKQGFKSLEIILNGSNIAVYINSNDPIINRVKGHRDIKHEFAVLSEMEVAQSGNVHDVDRFLKGFRGNDDTDDSALLPTMLVMSPNEYVKKANDFEVGMKVLEDSAALHPVITYNFKAQGLQISDIMPSTNEGIENGEQSCQLRLENTFSSYYIIDKYEIERIINNENSKSCIKSLANLSNGGMDLELPVFKVDEWGSMIDIEIDPKCFLENGLEIPVHMRYGEVTRKRKDHRHQHLLGDTSDDESAELFTSLPFTKLYWECSVADADVKKGIKEAFINEPGRFTIGHGSNTTSDETVYRRFYYPVDGNASGSSNMIKVPTINVAQGHVVDTVVFLAVFISFVIIVWRSTRRIK